MTAHESQANEEAAGDAHHRSPDTSGAARDLDNGWDALRARVFEAAEVLWREAQGIIGRKAAKAQLEQIIGTAEERLIRR
jgi:hypothetical protein